ncbi:MAG: hypothetical protein AAGJ82_07865 [Bacteroidota bacterium]
MLRFLAFLLVGTLLFGACTTSATEVDTDGVRWSLVVEQANGQATKVCALPADWATTPQQITTELDSLIVKLELEPRDNYTAFTATATALRPQELFLSLRADFAADDYQTYNFNGPVDSAEIFRQSPHDIDAWIVKTIAMQAVPVVAVQREEEFTVAVSDAPFQYANFTSQQFYPARGTFSLSSGDNGQSPGIQPDTSQRLNLDYNADKTQVFSPGRVIAHYHEVTPERPHTLEGILFKTRAADFKALRQAITYRVADHFSEQRYQDYFGALAFTTAYMNLRANDSGKSKYWVVPAVEYGNTQYGRDAFWISSMLDPVYDAACLESELAEVNHFAEYPLVTLIWAYRAERSGLQLDRKLLQAYVDAIELRVRNDRYYSFNAADGRLDFQYWGDVMAFEKDDIIAYNQGLFAIAMRVAKEMGLTVNVDEAAAAQVYRDLYHEELGMMPVSEQKLILSPDALVPDLLAQLYLEEPLLTDEQVRRHFERMRDYAKTDYGFKIVSTPTGEYLPAEQYDIPGYVSQVNREKMPDGRYFRGGSYFLYDNLFLIDAYLHGIAEAEELLKWRVGLDFATGSTTYETLNTLTGEPWKPNMGWNVAIYAFWRQLMDQGLADDELLQSVASIVQAETQNQSTDE